MLKTMNRVIRPVNIQYNNFLSTQTAVPRSYFFTKDLMASIAFPNGVCMYIKFTSILKNGGNFEVAVEAIFSA